MPPYDTTTPASSDSDMNTSAASSAPPSSADTSVEDDDTMPDLQSLSDSSEDEMSDSSAEDVSMPTVHNGVGAEDIGDHDDPEPPFIEPINFAPNPLRSGIRRPRVEDDHDDDRDRRHPSQRISRSDERLSSGGPSQPTPGLLPFFQQTQPAFPPFPTSAGRDGAPTNENGGSRWRNRPLDPFPIPPNTADADPRPRTHGNARDRQQRQQMPPMFGGFAITIDLSTGNPIIVPHPPPQQHAGADAPPSEPQVGQTPPQGNPFATNGAGGGPDFATFADIMARLGMLGAIFGMGGEREQEDPERARRLVDGLEEVPIGLVRRLERVGGDKDEGGGIGDSGCAICWDRLLDGDGQGFGEEKVKDRDDPSDTTTTEQASSPHASGSGEGIQATKPESTLKHPKIVTLPCAHVFHASCLIPWFSRPGQTTCPTCRFNIDPENLTWQRRRRTHVPTGAQPGDQPTQPGGMDTNVTADPNGAAAPIATLAPINPAFAQPQATTAGQLDDMPPLIDVSGRTVPPLSTNQPIGVATSAPPSATPASAGGNAPPPNRPIDGTPTSTEGQPDLPRSGNMNDGNGGRGRGFMTIGFDVIFGPEPGGMPPVGDEQGEDGDGADEDEMMDVDIATWERMMDEGATGADGEDLQDPAPTQGTANPTGAGPPPEPARELPEGHPFRAFQGGFRNMGPGVHVAAGIGRTMSEAFSQLLGGLTGPMPPPFQPGNMGGGNANSAPPAGAPPNPNPENLGHGHAEPQAQPAATAGPQSPHGARPQAGPTLPPFAHLFPGLGNIRRFGGGPSNTNPSANPGLTPPGTGSPPLAQLFGTFGFPSPTAQQAQQPAAPEPTRNNGTNPGGNPPPQQQQQQQGTTLPPFDLFFNNIFGMPPMNRDGAPADPSQPRPRPPRQRRETRERKEWVLPPAPGPTLRQRIERKEREAGLRCDDMSCGVGPSDEDPFVAVGEGETGQVYIRRHGRGGEEGVCLHQFHPSCLVTSERVALRGAEPSVVDGEVDVSCPVCREVGMVLVRDWEAGVESL